MPDQEQVSSAPAAPPAAPAPAAPAPAPAVPGRAAAPPAPAPTVLEGSSLPAIIDPDFSTYKRSESIAKLAAAIAQAQKKVENATRDSVNPHFKGKYASLAAVRNACRDALCEQGIAVFQPTTSLGKRVSVTTLLVLGDEWIESTLHISAGAETAQAIGSALTYGRRYGLAAMTGVAPEDDDGTEATSTLPQGVRQDAGKNSPLQQAAVQNGGGTSTPSTPSPATPIPVTPAPSAVPPPARPKPAPAPAPVPAAQQAAEIGKPPQSTVPPPPPGMKPPAKAPGA